MEPFFQTLTIFWASSQSEVQECSRVLVEQINGVSGQDEVVRKFWMKLMIQHLILLYLSANEEGALDFGDICTQVLSVIPVSTRPWDEEPRPRDKEDDPILNYNQFDIFRLHLQNEECKCNPSSVLGEQI